MKRQCLICVSSMVWMMTKSVICTSCPSWSKMCSLCLGNICFSLPWPFNNKYSIVADHWNIFVIDVRSHILGIYFVSYCTWRAMVDYASLLFVQSLFMIKQNLCHKWISHLLQLVYMNRSRPGWVWSGNDRL